jgi:hypothetical protein
MPLGYTSQIINSQLVPVAPEQAFNPLTFGQAYTGPAMWPRQGVYNVPPVLPSPGLMTVQAPGAYGATGAGGFPLPTAQGPGGNPYHPTMSPLLWALAFLVVGLLLLQHVHWRK